MTKLYTSDLKTYYADDKDYAYIQEIQTIITMLDLKMKETFVVENNSPFPKYRIIIKTQEGETLFGVEICFTDVTVTNGMRWSHINIVKQARTVDSSMNKSTGLKYINEYLQQYFEMSELQWRN